MVMVRGGTQERSSMNLMLPAKYFTAKGLESLMGIHQRLQSLS